MLKLKYNNNSNNNNHHHHHHHKKKTTVVKYAIEDQGLQTAKTEQPESQNNVTYNKNVCPQSYLWRFRIITNCTCYNKVCLLCKRTSTTPSNSEKWIVIDVRVHEVYIINNNSGDNNPLRTRFS